MVFFFMGIAHIEPLGHVSSKGRKRYIKIVFHKVFQNFTIKEEFKCWFFVVVKTHFLK